MNSLELHFSLPDWLRRFIADQNTPRPNVEDRMQFVIALSRENVNQKTGGPFAAAVFDSNARLIAAGLNIVETTNCSIMHAEIVAIALAQKALNRYDISNAGREHHELLASTEPCAMCFGAIPWSGVSRLVCAARDADARSIGFDEGPKLPDWPAELESRGIEVVRAVLRNQAVAVLKQYADLGGTIYNPPRHEDSPGQQPAST